MYNYESERSVVFTEDGQKMFLEIRDRVARLIVKSGCIRMNEAIRGTSGTTWEMFACVERLAELGEIVEVKYKEDRMIAYKLYELPFKG